MLGKKETTIYGLEKAEQKAYVAWLNQPEGKYHQRVLAAMATISDRNALKAQQQGEDYEVFKAKREQFIGQGIILRRVADMKRTLDEA
jgi:hypothetical protein